MELFYAPADPGHIKKEREKARELRKTQWWQHKLQDGLCHYCGIKFGKEELTMDHVVPIGRYGKSVRGNVVVCCKACNSKKSHKTPVEMVLAGLSTT